MKRRKNVVLQFVRTVHLALRRRLAFAWRPTDIDGCVLWLRPSAGVTTMWRSLVTRWRDGASRHVMVSAKGSESPLLVQRSASLNQRPSIRFALGERLESRPGIRQPIGGEGLSVFAVVSPASFGSAAELLRWAGWTVDVGIDLDARNGLHGRVHSRYESGVHLLDGRPYLVGLVIDERDATLHVNGAIARTFTGVRAFEPDVDAPAPLYLGGEPGHFRGEIGDVVIYDHALSPAELAALTRGLCAHYGFAGEVGASWFERVRARLALLLRNSWTSGS